MKVHAAVARALADNGVDLIFGLLGDANMFYFTSFVDEQGRRVVGATVEGGAVSMADGYARMSGKVGVVGVTHGPATTNTITAMIEAVRAHTPLVLITGDPAAKRGAAQRIDIGAVFSATGAHYHRSLKAEHVVDDVAIVLVRALATRRPVVLDVSSTMMEEDVTYRPSRFTTLPDVRSAPDPDALDRALGILVSARRPVILAGRGAVLSDAGGELAALADALGAPLATTASAKDLFRGHPYDLGIMGSVSTDDASRVLAASDCIAAFGASLSRHTTLDGALVEGKAVIHCDIDPANVGLGAAVDAALYSDAALTARAMCAQLEEASVDRGVFRTDYLGEGVLGHDPRSEFTDRSTNSTLDPRTAMILLDRFLPRERVVVSDVGRFVPSPWRYLHVPHARQFAQTGSYASIGLGISTAIGAAAATPGTLTVGVAGDGGAMMGLIELSTAVRHQIPLVVVVINDRAYGAEYSKFESAGIDPRNSFIAWPELADVARSLGCDGYTVRDAAGLEDAVRGIGVPERPVLIDIRVDPAVDPTRV